MTTKSHHSSAANGDPVSEPLPVVVWVEQKGTGTAYYLDTKDITADPQQALAEACQQHRGTEEPHPVVAIIDDRLPLSTVDRLRELIGRAGFSKIRYFSLSRGSSNIVEISLGHVASVPNALQQSRGKGVPHR